MPVPMESIRTSGGVTTEANPFAAHAHGTSEGDNRPAAANPHGKNIPMKKATGRTAAEQTVILAGRLQEAMVPTGR